MARSLLLSSVVAAAVFGAATAEFARVSIGAAGTTNLVPTNGCSSALSTTIANAFCLDAAGANVYKWVASAYTGGKFSGSVTKDAKATTADMAAGTTLLDTPTVTADAAATKAKLVSATGTGTTFIVAFDAKTTTANAITFGLVASVSAGGALTGLIGAGAHVGTTAASTFARAAEIGVDGSAAAAQAYKKAAAAGAADAVFVPQLFSMACNTAGDTCLFEAVSTAARLVAWNADAATVGNGKVYYLSESNAAAATPTNAAARKILTNYNGQIKYTSGTKYAFADKYMIRVVDTSAQKTTDGTMLASAPATDSCDAILNAGGSCSTGSAPSYPAAAAATVVHTGLALKDVKTALIMAFWVSTDLKTLYFVDRVTAATGQAAGSHALVRCTYATAQTDAGSSCAKLHTYAPLANGPTAMTEMFAVANPAAIGSRFVISNYLGLGDVLKASNIETIVYGTQSRTVTPQTPVPTCKRNGRKYCTKTKTLAKATTTTSTNGTTTNGSSTNASSNTTKTTTTTTSASAPLLASAWAMVGVVAALIAA